MIRIPFIILSTLLYKQRVKLNFSYRLSGLPYRRNSITYFLTHLLTPWIRVLLEKLTGLQLVKQFGISQYFMEPEGWLSHSLVPETCLYPEPARSNPYPPHPTSLRSILVLFSHLRLDPPSDLVPYVPPPKPCICLYSPHTCYMPSPSHYSRFNHTHNSGWGVQIMGKSIPPAVMAVGLGSWVKYIHFCHTLTGKRIFGRQSCRWTIMVNWNYRSKIYYDIVEWI
jgi:hypothetical protein